MNRLHSDQTYGEIFTALAKAQGQFPNVTKELVAKVQSQKGDYSYSYADLGACLEAVRRPLAENGLAILQFASQKVEGDICVHTHIVHSSGEWIDCGELIMSPQRPGPQAIGSVITYARRYALAAALGLAQTDDDGQAAQPPAEPKMTLKRACELLDGCTSREEMLAVWGSFDAPMREQLTAKRTKKLQEWKERFRADSNPQQPDEDQIDEKGAEDAS